MSEGFWYTRSIMVKQKKKRNKVYQGADAKNARPQVVRISAENRSASRQWLYEHRKARKPVLVAIAIVVVLVILIIGIVGAINP